MALEADDLASMVTFARVVEAGSFTSAARTLAIAKSVVSSRVSALERRLGVRLLQRSTRQLSLTAEGARFYAHCANVVRALEDANDEADEGEPSGTLRVSAPAAFNERVLAGAAIDFVRRHPRVRIDITVSNELVNLVEQRVDLAIRTTPRLEGASLVARRLGTAAKVVCASPAYVKAHGAPGAVADVPLHPCLRFSVLPQEAEWRFIAPNEPVRAPLLSPIVSDSTETLRQAAVAGLGLAVFIRLQIAEDLEVGRLVTVLDDAPLEPLGIFAVHTHGKVVPRKIRAFVDHLATTLAAPRWREMSGGGSGASM